MLRLLLTFTICAFVFSLCGSAADLSVPDAFPTIQAAIDAASPGDTVFVKPGTYTETLRIKDGVSLKGENREQTIVQCARNAGSPLEIRGVKIGRVEGITFQHVIPTEKVAPCMFPFPVVQILESDVSINDCTVRNGASYGIILFGGAPTIEKCLVESNDWTGIFCVDSTTRPTIAGCVVRGNKMSGMSIYWDGLHVVARDNLIQDNGIYGIVFGDDVSVVGEGNDYTRNAVISYQEITRLGLKKEFVFLEAIVKRLREDKTRFPSGEWQLPFFYNWLIEGTEFMGGESEVRFFKMVDAWKAEYPDSLTWRIILSKAYKERAWGYRGSGFAHTVTREGWKGYEDYINRAWKVLDECAKIEPKDPEYYQVRAELVMEAPPSSGGAPSSLMGAIVRMIAPGFFSDPERTPFVKGVALEPLYYPLYYERVRALLPRWGGSRKDMLKFADRSAKDTESLAGDTLYAVIATSVQSWEPKKDYLAYGFSWPRIQKGYDRILQDFPNSDWRRSLYCWMACIHEDKASAAVLFDSIGDYWDWDVWDTESRFKAYRKWALEGAPYPAPSPLEVAIRDGDAYKVEGLLNSGADPKTTTIDGESLALVAITNEEPEILRLLLEAGADPDLTVPGEEAPLYYALPENERAYVDLLLKHGADPNKLHTSGWTPLMLAIRWEHPEYVKPLLKAGADPNLVAKFDTSPLREAVLKRDHASIKVLLEYGANPNWWVPGMNPIFTKAVQAKDPAMCELLLNYGANVNIPDDAGRTPLIAAADGGDLPMMRLLLARGADIEVRQKNGWTIYHASMKPGVMDVLAFLLESFPEGVDMPTDQGRTPLHVAAEHGKLEFVKLLLEHGADVNAVDKESGKTALGIAVDGGFTEVADFLRERGGK